MENLSIRTTDKLHDGDKQSSDILITLSNRVWGKDLSDIAGEITARGGKPVYLPDSVMDRESNQGYFIDSVNYDEDSKEIKSLIVSYKKDNVLIKFKLESDMFEFISFVLDGKDLLACTFESIKPLLTERMKGKTREGSWLEVIRETTMKHLVPPFGRMIFISPRTTSSTDSLMDNTYCELFPL